MIIIFEKNQNVDEILDAVESKAKSVSQKPPSAQNPDSKVLELDAKVKNLEERLLRLGAEFENYKKRSLRDNEFVRENASSDILIKILPFLDEFEIALNHLNSKDVEFAKGMKMVFSKLHQTLKNEGLEEFGKVGEDFDPHKHEGLRHIDGPDGKIVDIIQKGYVLRGRLLRAAKVSVGNGN